MYFENDVVQIDLDESYLNAPDTAEKHAADILLQHKIDPKFLKPKNFTASTLPDIPANFDFMCCPRSISSLCSKIGFGYVGQRVNRIASAALFPVLITSPVYKPWKSIAAFFGGSCNAVNALKLAFRISRISEMPLQVFTQAENSPGFYKDLIKKENMEKDMEKYVSMWHIFEQGTLENNLYEIPHDALVVLGAFGHGFFKDLIFGSKMEKIQSVISNNLLIAGPRYTVNI